MVEGEYSELANLMLSNIHSYIKYIVHFRLIDGIPSKRHKKWIDNISKISSINNIWF